MSGNLRQHGARTLAHVRGARQHGGAAIPMQPDDRIRSAGRGRCLDGDGKAASPAFCQRGAPADRVHSLPYRLGPIAIGRCVAGNESLALAGEVSEPDVYPVDA